MKKFLTTLLLLLASKGFSYQYDLAVCAIFQNEAPYLKEWIDFHKTQGVQHFYLFNNRSEDAPHLVLQPYIDAKEVTLLFWPHQGQVYAQYTAYDMSLGMLTGKAKWVAYLDTDEFLFTTSGQTLVDFLKNFENLKGVSGVCVNWQMFGTSGVHHIASGEFLIEKLLLKAPREYGENVHVKTIVRPEFTLRSNTPHCFIYKDGYFAVDPCYRTITGPFNPDIPVDEIRINHYFCRTREFAYGEKLRRLMRCNGWSEEAARSRIESFDRICNVELDNSILIYLPKLSGL